MMGHRQHHFIGTGLGASDDAVRTASPSTLRMFPPTDGTLEGLTWMQAISYDPNDDQNYTGSAVAQSRTGRPKESTLPMMERTMTTSPVSSSSETAAASVPSVDFLRYWTTDCREVKTFRGHSHGVWAVAFGCAAM